MTARLQGYGFALCCIVLVIVCRKIVAPYIGFGIIYGFLVLAIWVSGRFSGLGPSLLVLFLGGILLVVLRYTERRFYWTPLEFQASLALYSTVGGIICFLCNAEHKARASLIRQLAEGRVLTQSLNAEQDLLRQTIQLQDQERRLIAYEVHDGMVQHATGALLQLEAIRRERVPDAFSERLDVVIGLLQMTVGEGRQFINGLHATVLDDCGLTSAVRQLVEEHDPHLKIEFVADDGIERMAPKTERALYRITQEALTNCRRHSNSNKARIELSLRGDRVHLEVRDWGVGLSQSFDSSGRYGLRGMIERAVMVGGQCMIENAPGGGTLIVADVPYLNGHSWSDPSKITPPRYPGASHST